MIRLGRIGKKGTAVGLAVFLAVSMMPVSAFADGNGTVEITAENQENYQYEIPVSATMAQLGRRIPFIHLDKVFTSVI